MDRRAWLVAVGVGATTFLVAGALVIEAFADAGPGAGILGVAAGAVAGLLATTGVGMRFRDLRPGVRRVLTAVAVFGLVFLGIWALRYVAATGVRYLVDASGQLAISVVAAVAAFVASWLRDTERPVGG